MSETRFVHVTYIRTTPEKLWDALTDAKFMKKYWFGMHLSSEWKPGASWKLVFADGNTADQGEVLEIDPPRLLVLRWRNEFKPDMRADGDTTCRFEIVPDGETVRLTVIHEADRPHKLIGAVADGWPRILSSLKSLLETGDALPRSHGLGCR